MTNHITAEVIENQGKLKFIIQPMEEESRIYYSTNPTMNEKHLLTKSKESIFDIDRPIADKRLFFQITNDLEQSNIFATRVIPTASIDNFRDLGGYVGKDKRKVKWGYFYRSASLFAVNHMDKSLLIDMNIKTIFDFRSSTEVKSAKDIELPGCSYINESGIKGLERTLSSDNNFDMKSLIMGILKTPDKITDMEDFLKDGYIQMVQSNEAFRIFFNRIKCEENVPIIFHCTAGKDRTGVAGALLLLCLGVDEETVIEDYELSNQCRAKTNEAELHQLKEVIKDEKLLKAIKAMLGVKSEYLKLTLNLIKEKYNSYEDYIISEMGMSKEELVSFQEKYLY